MKRLLKKCTAAAIAITIVAAGLTGCGKSDNTGEKGTESKTEDSVSKGGDTEGKPDTWIADRTIVVQAYVDDIGYSLPTNMAETPVMKELTKRTGIKLDIQYTPGDSDSAVLASHLASGSIPDVIITYLNDSTRKEFPLLLKAAKEGMFADVSSFIKDSKVYSNYLKEGFLPSDSYKNITFREDFNGAAYLMQLYIDKVDRSAEFNPQKEYLGGMYIQKSIADALGIDPKTIKTQDQLYDLLVQIRDGGFKDDNGNAVYPLGPKYWGGSADCLEFVLRNFDWGISDGYNLTEDGEIKHEVETDYVFDKINYVRKLLAEGLMNPEFFTMDGTRAEEASRTHNSAIIADVHNYQEIVYSSEDWIPLGLLNDFTGNSAQVKSGKTGYGAWAISAEAENPEEIFRFFDYLATEEGQLLTQYGVEGEHYTMVDGKPKVTDEVLQKLNENDTDYLVNQIGAGFVGSGVMFFDFVMTNIDFLNDFGESRPGASASTVFKRSVDIATEYPRVFRVIPGLDATAYLSDPSMADIKAQMALLNYKEMLVQAMYANSDDEAKAIVESFREQLKAAGNEEFKAFVKKAYDEDPTRVNFYTK